MYGFRGTHVLQVRTKQFFTADKCILILCISLKKKKKVLAVDIHNISFFAVDMLNKKFVIVEIVMLVRNK